MTTLQCIIINVFLIIGLIGYFGPCFPKYEKRKVLFAFLSLISIMFFWCLAIAQTKKVNELLEKKGKCPEYEKVENVYRLKS